MIVCTLSFCLLAELLRSNIKCQNCNAAFTLSVGVGSKAIFLHLVVGISITRKDCVDCNYFQ